MRVRARTTAVTAVVTAGMVVAGVAGAAPALAAVPGTPYTFGSNSFGELGSGGSANRFSAGPVVGINDAVELHGGREHVVALRANGAVWTWGSNQHGQIGDGTSGTANNRRSPVQVTGLSGIEMVSGGHYHSMALLADGTVRAWGNNAQSQLGDGTTSRRTRPVAVTTGPGVNLSGVTLIAGGRGHSLALLGDGTVRAWGYNATGGLGDGTFTTRSRAVRVLDLTNVVALAGGRDHSLALRSDGTVWAFGDNTYGQVGDGTKTHRSRPVRVVAANGALTNVVAVAAGAHHSMALRADGTVWTWGRNYRAQLGDNTTTTRTRAVQVSGLTGVVAIAGGRDHGLAVLGNGTVRSWGDNAYGQLGDGTTTTRRTPVTVPGLSGITAVTAGRSYSAAL
jgi:alpha-tubulin suppressor-like RCC1 family protein